MARDTKAGISIRAVKYGRYEVTGFDGRKIKTFVNKPAAFAFREGLIRGIKSTQQFLGTDKGGDT